jgi:hypothetical protein
MAAFASEIVKDMKSIPIDFEEKKVAEQQELDDWGIIYYNMYNES